MFLTGFRSLLGRFSLGIARMFRNVQVADRISYLQKAETACKAASRMLTNVDLSDRILYLQKQVKP